MTERAKVARTVARTATRTASATAARTAGATVKAAGVTVRAAGVTAKAAGATAKAAGSTAAAARSAIARRTVTGKPATAEVASPEPATEAPVEPAARTPAAAASAVRRPTPYRRAETPAGTAATVVEPEAPAAADTAPLDREGGRRSSIRRRVPSGRRPALGLAAALVGVVSISAASVGEPAAKADTGAVGDRISVAEALDVDAGKTQPIVSAETTDRLGELVASRTERDAEQAEATRVQAAADREAVEAARRAAAAAAEAARPDVVLPVDGARLTSGFGARWGTLHAGIDLAAPMRTPEYAAMDGVVLEAGPASGFGLAVYIQHRNGDVTVYGHMDEILVSAGQVVRAGETIALLGNTGQSTGPHLHFEVHQGGLDGTKIDPVPWLRAGGVDI